MYNQGLVISKEKLTLEGKVIINCSEVPVDDEGIVSNDLLIRKDIIEKQIDDALKDYDKVISDLEKDKQTIIENTKKEAITIEKNAYEEGYNQGLKNGYEDGYKDAYEKNIEKAQIESEEIRKSANEILLKSNEKMVEYMKENKKNILKLSVSIAEKVLRDKFEEVESMNTLLEQIIEEYNLKKSFIINVNAKYVESIENQLENLISTQGIKGDIFVIADDNIQPGNAIINTNEGKILIGIDSILERIKEELL